MTEHQLQMLAHNQRMLMQVIGFQIRAMGMAAENASRADQGLSPAYTETQFFDVETLVESATHGTYTF